MPFIPSITISWNAEPSAQTFNVYRGTLPSNISDTPIATGLVSPTYTDLSVVPGAVYSYEVTAVANGVESAPSLIADSYPVPFAPTPLAPDFVGLDNFSVLASSTVTSTGNTTVVGDVGTSPGTSITGFPPAVFSGVLHSADYVSALGEATAQAHYNSLAAYVGATIISGDLGGQTLAPGVYKSTSTIGITGQLALDAGGDPNAVWIFQIGSALTTATSSTIVLLNGASAGNVFWQIGSSATVGATSVFCGTIVAQASISCGSGASVAGRLLALTGAITLIDNTIVLFDASPFLVYQSGTAYLVGEVIYDCASNMFQEVTQAGTTASGNFNLTSVNVQFAGEATYNGSFLNGAADAFVGDTFVVSGFSNAANNGTFTCLSSSTTSINLNNGSAVNQTMAATATANTRPAFSNVAGSYTQDGSVQWYAVSPVGVFVQLPLPPSPPNVAPAPPAAPTGLVITSEV